MVSYVDDKLGERLNELARLGLDGDTAVVFCTDHGDMLGEHGMWSKRTFYDWSARVPMIWSWRGRWAGGRRVSEPVSLVDLFPTLLELAGVDSPEVATSDIDGASLLAPLDGRTAEARNAVISEYCGEGVIRPMRMICSGRHKYVHVKDERPLLFDLKDDPNELKDLQGRPEFAALEAELREELLADWDAAEVERQVLASQQARLLINDAMATGKAMSWDFQPPFDASHRYVRD